MDAASGRLRRAATVVTAALVLASTAFANHDTDCTASGGTNGPAQLDCRLPDFAAELGSTKVLTSSFRYTPSVENNPPTCAVGTMAVNPPGQWLSIDSSVLDASGAGSFDDVVVSVDPSGLPTGLYEGSVMIMLIKGSAAPECPSAGDLTGTVSVRLVVGPVTTAPLLSAPAVMLAALMLIGAGIAGLRTTRSSNAGRR